MLVKDVPPLPGQGMAGGGVKTNRLFSQYRPHELAWDELFGRERSAHPHCLRLIDWLNQLDEPGFRQRRLNADLVFVNQGITFSVYSDRRGVEKIFPFDLIPRPIASKEWERLDRGLRQRIQALNLFLHDVYHGQ